MVGQWPSAFGHWPSVPGRAGPQPVEFGDRSRDVAQAVGELLRANRELIQLARPLTAYNRCGYQLHDALTDDGLDLVKVVVGSEGTLAFVTEATLRTVPLAGVKAPMASISSSPGRSTHTS